VAITPVVVVSVVVTVVSAASVAVTVGETVTVDVVDKMQLQALLTLDAALPHWARMEAGSAEGS
jgi:uncharacterized membrane protein